MIGVKYELTEKSSESAGDRWYSVRFAWKPPIGCPSCRDRVSVGSIPLEVSDSDSSTSGGGREVHYSCLTTTFLYCPDCAKRLKRLKVIEKKYEWWALRLIAIVVCAIIIAAIITREYGLLVLIVLAPFLLIPHCVVLGEFSKRERKISGWYTKALSNKIYFENNEIGIDFASTNGFQVFKATGQRTLTADVKKSLGDILASFAISHGHVLVRRGKDWAYLSDRTLPKTQLGRAFLCVLIWWLGIGRNITWTYSGVLFVSPKGIDDKERREVLLLLRQVPTLKRVDWTGRKGKGPVGIYLNTANLRQDDLTLVASAVACAGDARQRQKDKKR